MTAFNTFSFSLQATNNSRTTTSSLIVFVADVDIPVLDISIPNSVLTSRINLND